MDVKLSCGLLVLNEHDELLVGHSTGSFHWDLPKGLLNEGESPMACALREAYEEFGLAFTPERLVDLGRQAYYPGKDLHLFAVRTTMAETDLDRCRCRSFFAHPKTGQSMSEVDGFAWSDEQELTTRLAKSMKRLLLDEGLLARAKALATGALQVDG
jgi:putative (di)nucleoside polyphosphate hydrolase